MPVIPRPLLAALSSCLATGISWMAIGQDAKTELPESLIFRPATGLNAVTLFREGSDAQVSFYRPAVPSSPGSALALTHVRRGIVEAARASGAERLLAPATTPEARQLLSNPQSHWEAWWDDRFDYYGQQVTRLPTQPLAITDWLEDEQEIEVAGFSLRVLATPGVTREGITYLAEVDGKTIAFSGNLVLDGGKVADLYSFQDAVTEAKVGAYHGYGGRLGPWIASLEKLAAAEPDLIVPSQGSLITDPKKTLSEAIRKSREIYSNYLSTNALHWYFGAERMRACADRVLGPGAPMESLSLAEHVDLPRWVQHIGTTKLLVSDSKVGFALDVGGPKSLETLRKAVDSGLVERIEGIWVTHRHNDHTRSVRDAQDAFDCPVYAVESVAGALTAPGDHFSPGISPNAVREVTVLADGETMKWKEFQFTSRVFPGQMLDHGGLLVQPPAEKGDPVFFIGDSFSPSGIDDYCLMNRNLMREDTGYLRCFQIVREELPENTWLVNQHIPHLFRFTEKELDYLEDRYRYRRGMIADFTPWDDPNFAIDEQWAWLFPYGREADPGAPISLTLRIWNHSTEEREFTITPHSPEGVEIGSRGPHKLTIGAREQGELTFDGVVSPEAAPGVRVVTFSLESKDLDLPHWCEALVRVKAP